MNALKRRASVPEDILPLRDSFAFQVAMIHHPTSKFIFANHEQYGMTSNHWKVLSVVAHVGPLPSTEVTNWCSLDKAAVSRAVRKLLDDGLIRLGGRGGGTRAIDLEVTDAGLKIQQAIAYRIADFQDWLLSDLDEGERRWLLDTMDHLRTKLAEIDIGRLRRQLEQPDEEHAANMADLVVDDNQKGPS